MALTLIDKTAGYEGVTVACSLMAILVVAAKYGVSHYKINLISYLYSCIRSYVSTDDPSNKTSLVAFGTGFLLTISMC